MPDAPALSQSPPRKGGGSWLDHPTGRGTLGRRLVLRVVAIVAAVAAVVTVVTTLSTRAILVSQLDGQIDAASARQVGRPASGDCSSDVDGPGPAPGADVFGNVLGSVFVATCPSGGWVATLQQESGFDASQREKTQAAKAAGALLKLSADGRKHNLRIEGLGFYRAMSVERGSITYVVALPMDDVHRAVNSLLLVETGVGILALAASVVVCRAVVVRNLKPLNRLASTANQVSELDLDSGEVNLPVRVPPTLSDPATEVGQVGSAFNHMLNNVEGALEARQRSETKIRQFVADASHELRNPLASIRGYAELTHRTTGTPQPVTHAINRIQAQATRMSCLVEDMLLLARLDNDQQLDLTPTDLVEIVLNAVSDSQAAGTDHTWILDLPDDPVTVAADPDRLVQVIINVLSNARKHTPPGTTVTTTVTTDQGLATLTITDTGPGIPASVRQTVFERFARADTARTASTEGSTGLGLSIVAAVMDAHHGTVHIDSRTIDSQTQPSPDQSGQHGTTVTLTLPTEDREIRPE
ncbi:HAMP domain-containing sensor histidine kinase [Acidipropionibacterium virtanenii]|uniref:histidine kinase n=1 Tax=Acidipropionibacterium virtanenii TaxID=2057246 RepID=A0A344UWV7_9ACTN|nr:HAMP domain-containing sensor histidine kinase [Acidipropionibacterium virtanenii]AXE39755.1 putative sensor histidine kinase TcrY [Acidipropionibacterium virtanenii]